MFVYVLVRIENFAVMANKILSNAQLSLLVINLRHRYFMQIYINVSGRYVVNETYFYLVDNFEEAVFKVHKELNAYKLFFTMYVLNLFKFKFYDI